MKTSYRDYCQHAVLDDGSPVLVRAIQPGDKQSLSEAFSRLSVESVRSRFFRSKASLSDNELEYFTEVDFVTHVAIGVGLVQEERICPVGIGRYIVDADQPKSAELALTVDDAYHGIGVGALMLKHLSDIARAKGIETFHAVILAENKGALHVIQRSNHPFHVVPGDEILEVIIEIATS